VLSGGKKVLPEEVEAVLEKSPYFAEVCVTGVEHTGGAREGTEDVAAVIVPREELWSQYDNKALDTLIRAEAKSLSLRLSSYKRPVSIIIRREPLPRTSTKKIKRKEVRALIQ
jgi:long-chain acyl-CoA synthetase